MNINKSKIAIGVVSFGFGIASVFAAQHLMAAHKPESKPLLSHNQLKVDPLFDQFFNDDFFGRSRDPFEEMRRMRERMAKEFKEPSEGESLFDSWYGKRFGGAAAEITKREDDKFVYYDVSVKGLEANKLNAKVENGQIEISGEINQKTEDLGQRSEMRSSFHRSFPAPPNVDPNKVQMEQQKEKLVLKFPKLFTSS